MTAIEIALTGLILTGIGTFVALIGLIISIYSNNQNLKKSNEIQQDMLMHDMVKQEIVNWKYIDEQKKPIPKKKKNHIFNYYEYLAYLILIGKINEKHAKKIWKPNIFNMYKTFKEEFLGDRIELRRLYEKWKKEDEKPTSENKKR